MRTEGAPASAYGRLFAFRALVYGGAAVHFLPTLWNFPDSYAGDAWKTAGWSPGLHSLLLRAPEWVTWFVGGGALGTTLLACWGLQARHTTVIAAAGWFYLANVNSLHSQTLALSTLWALLLLQAILGGAHDVRPSGPSKSPASETLVLAQLTPGYVLGTVFFSGVHKVLAGWPVSGSINRLANYPSGGMLRPWMVGFGRHLSPGMGTALELGTLVCELLVPWLILHPRTRRSATAAYVVFFLAIGLTLAVPPLFVVMYLGAALLFKDLSWAALRRGLRRAKPIGELAPATSAHRATAVIAQQPPPTSSSHRTTRRSTQ